jgi:cyanophycinase
MRVRGAAAAAACVLLGACASAPTASPEVTRAGPAGGSLFIAGGGALDTALIARFVELAGGTDARIVIVPTAGLDETFPPSWPGYRLFAQAGVRDVRVLHTRDRAEADSEHFTAPLRMATGVWLTGGRQWRLTDVYLGTRTQREIENVMRRGGVVGGTSAGASVQASYMVRGAPESNTIMMAPGRDTGFGLLPDAAVDQHLTARGRQEDMLEVVDRHPALLGIGIDEGTAVVVTGDRAGIIGRGRVAFYNAADRDSLQYYFLQPGDTFDLATRSTVSGRRIPPRAVRDEAEVIRVVERLFDAMRTRDTSTIRTLLHERIRILVPLEQDGSTRLRVSTADDFIEQVALSPRRFDERAIRPIVRIDGPLASVWTHYEFLLDSEFSHCGTDSFQLLRPGDSWIITALAYTIRRDGCR